MATSLGAVPERDLILGFTRASTIAAPGMVVLSKVVPPATTFAQADMAGPWRVYLERVESKLSRSTWQIGLSNFGSTGAFAGATLTDEVGTATVLTTGSLAVAGNGSVTGTLTAGAGATADRYEIRGTMRGLKDLITGVLTVRLGTTTTYQGLVTLVREVTILDIGQASYAVAEGQPARVTVKRTGNQAGTVTVQYAAGGGTAPPGDYSAVGSGTLTFPPNTASRTFDVATTNDGNVQGSRTVDLTIAEPGGGAVLGAQTSATLTIQDNDVGGVVKFATPAVSVLEGSPAVLTLTRTGGTGGGVSVGYATSGVTATSGVDFSAAAGVVTFGPGDITKSITIPTLADPSPLVEGDETFRVSLQSPVGLTIGSPATATVTVLDAQQGIQFSVPEYTVNEGMTATITLVRTGPVASPATVRYATSPGSATPGADYTPVAGVVTFAANARTATFMVPTLQDVVAEGPETVLLTLSDPGAPAQLSSLRTAVLTIVDNDVPGVVKLGAAAYTVAEGARSVLVTVQRTGTAAGVTVSYATTPGTATAGQDYLTASGTLTFGAAETTKTIAVTILNDTLDEPAETFTLTLSNPGGGATLGSPASAVVTITDDDLPGVVAIGTPAVAVGESAGVATVIVTRTGGMAGGVTVDFATADGSAQAGSDYTARSGRLTFHAGETSKPVTIAILGDAVREGDETFTLALSNPGGGAALGAASVATITIRDDETGPTVQFGAATYTVVESAPKATVTVTRTGSTLAGQSVLVRTTTGGTAPADQFAVLAQTVVFAAGQASASVDLLLTAANGLVDGDRTVALELADPFSPAGTLSLGAPRRATLTIRDDDSQFRFSSAGYLAIEGAPATLTVQRVGAAITAASVKYATVNGTAAAPGQYAARSGTLMFAPGVASQTLTITTVNDTVARGDRDFTVVLSDAAGAALGAPSTATVQIQDNDGNGTVQFSAAAYSVLEGAAATITVLRTGGAAGPLTVGFATVAGGTAVGGPAPGPGVDYVTRTGTLTFAAGATSQTFTIATVPDTLAEGAKTVNLALSVPAGSGAVLGAQPTAVLTIVDDEQPRFQFAAPALTVSEGAGVASLTVMRVGPATALHTVGYALAGVTATAGVDFVAAGGTLTFPVGVASQTISVPVVADTLNEPAETFTVTLTGPSAGAALGTPSVATVTITDDDPAGTVQFTAGQYAVTEGGTITLTVMRTGTAGPVTVAYAASPGTATAGDYAAPSGTLTFAAGETTRTLPVITASADGLLEGAEYFEVVLSAPGGGLALGTPSRARVWILDGDQSLQFGAASYAIVEGGSVPITVTRGGAPAGSVTATVTLGGTAIAGVDYLVPASLALSFPAGVVTQTFTIQTLPDTLPEGARTITLGLTGLSGAVAGTPGTATLTIVDNERPDLAVTAVAGPAQAATGIPTTVTATVRNLAAGPAPASKLGVYLSSSSAVPGAGVRVALVDVPALAGLTARDVVAAVTIPGNVSTGTYFLSAVADPGGLITEENEGNNGLTAAAQVDVVLFLPDLIVTSVQPPANTLSGKLVSSPLQVRNAGLVASGPYRVGVYLSTDPTPGTGTLVATRDMPALAAGAGADVPVSLIVPDDLPQGAYFMSGVVDLDGVVAEASEANNALASAVPFQVTRNLTKLSSITASFTIAAAPGTCSLGAQTLNLAGTLSLASQTGTTGQGTLTLSGTLAGGGTVTFRGPFSATVNLDETVTIAFTATVTGALTGTATATGNGVIDTGVLSASITSGLLTVTAPVPGSCPFTGTLTAAGEPVFFFSLLHYVNGGGFNGFLTPAPAFPLAITEFSMALTALFDPLTPVSPSTVTFTGPAGSGISNVAAQRRQKNVAGYFYETDTFSVAGRTLTGPWSVHYRSATKAFTVTNPDTATRFVAMLPTVTLNSAQTHVTAISWVYKDLQTGATVPAPAYADAIQVEFAGFGIDYASPDFPRTVTSHTLPTPLPVADLEFLYISFKDTVTGHFYVTAYTQ